jgi:hypothetical protein
MRFRTSVILVGAILLLAPAASWAELAPYSQDFEDLVQPDPGALAGDGWLIFANVFGHDWAYWYGYGVFPAPNGGPGFSGIDVGQGGLPQGEQQLVVYSDYNNQDQPYAFIEANVFQEQWIGAADVGTTWRFKFDAKRGNIEGDSVARAFFKTLDPNAGWILTNFITLETTNVPESWGTYSVSIYIDPGLAGQVLQFGFLATATGYQGSGIFYDNINFDLQPLSAGVDVRPDDYPNPVNPYSNGVLPVALLGAADFDVADVDVTTLAFGPWGAAPRHDLTDPGTYTGHLQDVNMDGLMDLVGHYTIRETGIQCGNTEVTLSGQLLDGRSFEGTDDVYTVRCREPEQPRPVFVPETVETPSDTESSVFGRGD